MIAGRARKMGLGDFELVSLKDARKKRDAAYGLVVDGVDPIDERKARKAVQAAEDAKTLTFKECAESYIAAHKASWKSDKHAGQWEATLQTYVYPVIGSLPVQWSNRACHEDPPADLGDQDGDGEQGPRPDRKGFRSGQGPQASFWRKPGGMARASRPVLPAKSQVSPVENHPALPYVDLPAFMKKLRAKEGVSARALEFTILTAARTGDTIGGKRKEIDKAEKLWTVPAARMKGKKGARKRDHVVPLSEQALAALEAVSAEG